MSSNLFKICGILLLLVFSYISFSGKIYYFLQPFLGVPWAYVLDQGLFLFIILFFFVLLFLRNFTSQEPIRLASRPSGPPGRWLHAIYILLLLLISFVTHWFVLDYYFFSEDIHSILKPANNEYIEFPFSAINNGYPLLPFIFSFLVFKTNALGYNILSLSLFSFSVISVYWFTYLISKKKYLALLAGLLFATTPSYLDMFGWQASVQGMSLVLGLGICSLVFLIYYQRFSLSTYYFLSLLFFASALKIGFVRIAGLMLPLAFLSIFPLYKHTIWTRVLRLIPYVFLWIMFISLRFGIELFLAPFAFSRQNVSVPISTSSYFPALSYYVTHLFLPTYVARQFIPIVREIPRFTGVGYEIPSIIFMIGISLIAILLLILFRALFMKDVKKRWILIFSLLFIFSGLFYVPLFGTVPTLEKLDKNFISIIPPYGPGSRYVFFSAVGVAILFSIIIYFLHVSKKSFLRKASYLYLVLLVVVGSLLSMSAHKFIVDNISKPDKAFIDRFFALVPVDGKKKLVISLNPKNNAIETNVGGKNWLYGFYKSNELTYLDTLDEARTLVATGEYDQNNVYAFYDNPNTMSFKDVSSEIRQILFSKENDIASKDITFDKKQSNSTFSTVKTGWGPITILSRAMFESKELDIRILGEKKINITISLDKSFNGKFPYADIFFTNNTGIQQSIWTIIPENKPITFKGVQNLPSVFTLSSFDYQSLEDIPIETKKEIATILQNRELLRNDALVTVSSKRVEDKRVNEQSIIDGLYTDNPRPADNQRYYVAGQLPTIIILELPYVITLGRISMNSSRSYSEHYPTDIDIFTSYDGEAYQKSGSIENKIESSFSPNNGRLITIPLENIEAKFIKIRVNNTAGNQPVMFDEIVVDDIPATKYAMEQIWEYKNNAFLHVESQELLNQLIMIGAYNYLPIVYACAEDSDWDKQKSNYNKLLPGIWNVDLFQMNSNGVDENFSVLVNCFGSSLRKVIIFGPPYPSEMKIKRVTIQ